MESAASQSVDVPPTTPPSFRFSLSITLTCITLACLMIWASSWQWEKYKAKVALRKSYAEDSGIVPSIALPAPSAERGPPGVAEPDSVTAALQAQLYKKVELYGRYDLDRQLIVTNRRHASGPGHSLFAPFRLIGENGAPSEVVIWVSRGFIPFDDRTPESWKKYDQVEPLRLVGVVKPAKTAGTTFLSPKSSLAPPADGFQRIWFFEEIAGIAAQLPYPAIRTHYLEKVPRTEPPAPAPALQGANGSIPNWVFPAEQISFEVPPTTHFGYTIEWALLAVATLIIGWALQAIPSLRRKLRLG